MELYSDRMYATHRLLETLRRRSERDGTSLLVCVRRFNFVARTI